MFLNAGYNISIQDRNVVLERFSRSVEKTKKDDEGASIPTGEFTKDSWVVVGFYPTHKAALRGFIDLELRGVPQNFFELSRKIDELYSLIEDLEVTQ